MSSTFRIAVLVSGRGSNLKALIDTVHQKGSAIEIVSVISDKPDAPALELATSAGIPIYVVSDQSDRNAMTRNLIEATNAAQPDLVVLAGFMRILKSEFIEKFRHRIINIHPSLLPAFRGLRVQEAAITAGARFSGCTVHYVVPEVDAGPIIAQAVVPVFPNDNADDLSARILKQEHRLLPAVVRGIAEGKIRVASKDGRDYVEVDTSVFAHDESAALRSLVS